MWRSKCVALVAALCLLTGVVVAQSPSAGVNINMVSGTQYPDGDPYLQRQNEPTAAVSSRNPLHLLAAANDYRSVDIPFPQDQDMETGDAWLGIFRSTDGGLTWKSTLLPGFPQDQSGLAPLLKNYAVATDPTLRAGTHGLFYMSGLAFNRGSNSPSASFVAVYQDQNNKGNGNPFNFVSASLVDTGTSGQFLDKPWIAVDVPRSGTAVGTATCNINGQTLTSGNVYVVYSTFLGTQPSSNPHTQILVATSKDCGKTWINKQKLSESFALNQGTVATIDPTTGALYVAWRQLANGSQPDQILYAMSTDGGQTFTKGQAVYTFAPGTPFDQGVSSTAFRTLALPALAVDGSGRPYIAFSLRNMGPNGAARIMMTTLGNKGWSTPWIADASATGSGHQFLPTLSFAYGKLTLTYYDQRDDNTIGVLQCPVGKTCATVGDFVETRVAVGDRAAGPTATVFNTTISDAGLLIRHTLDVRGLQADTTQFNNGSNPPITFTPFRVSQYKYGSRPGNRLIEQMQFNVPNFPLFAKGTKPFIGDYADVTAQYIFADGKGNWKFNTAPSNAPVFHAIWTDNRDVRTPPITCNSSGVCTQDWTQYTPVGSTGGTSSYDPSQQKPVCVPGDAGMRNQNIYTTRITQGLVVGLRENSKQLLNGTGAPITRQFAAFVQNNTNQTAYYRLTINTPFPANTTASFQSSVSILSVDIAVPARSTAARGLFVTSSLTKPSLTVTATQISALNGNVIANGLQTGAIINPDITNPDITNPDITNPDITNPDITNPDITNPDITNAEVYNPTVTNPDITNPDITNPDITNPDITNPDITNPDITNPDITNPDITTMLVTNPDITNPDITNPDITNPDITNPDITNPDITNLSTGVTDFTWKITNKGNTSSSYNAKLLSAQQLCCPSGCQGSSCPAGCYKCQLVLRRTYPTPIANQCQLTVEVTNVPNASIPNPVFSDPSSVGTPDLNGNPTNGTLSLGPGEAGRMTLRVYGLATNAPIPGLGAAAVAFSGNTGQAVAAASLTITTTALPPMFTGVPYSTQLQTIGGVGALSWSVFSGSLPAGITLDPATGILSGTPTGAAGSQVFTIQVIDSPPSPIVPHVYRQPFSVTLQQFSISSVNAFKIGTSAAFAKTGDQIEVDVSVTNIGSLVASNVQVFVTVLPNGATATCGLSNPPSSNIQPGQTAVFTFTCGNLSGNGSVGFSATATGTFAGVGSAASVTSAAATANVVIDNVPPVITAAAKTSDGLPYTSGTWTNKSVTVTFSCTDSLSGVGSFTQPVTISTAGTNQSVNGSCTDNAGNTASTSFTGIDIALGGPAISATRSPLPNASGWNNSPVTVTYTCTPTVAPIASQTAPQTLSADGAGQSTSGSCTDAAGNSTTTTVTGINIDRTAPTISFTRSPAANAAGWNSTPVTVSFLCTDSLSGVASQPAPVTLSTEGANQSASGSCSDIAGNTASTTASGINIDKTVPTVVITSPVNGSILTYGANTTMQFNCADGLSGLASCVGVPAQGAALNTTSFGTQTVSATATDKAGNTFTVTSSYSVNYKFTGFQTPLVTAGTVSNPSFSGAFNAGKAIPIKWDLFNSSGTLITDLSTLKLLTATANANCAGVPPAGSFSFALYNPTAGATGGSTFRSSSSGYIFNWDTSSVGKGCYNLVITIVDGTQYATIVKLQ